MRIAVLAAALLLATPAFAAIWTVDKAKSRLGFSLPWGAEPYAASFKSWKADIRFEPSDLAHAQVSVAIDTGSETSGDAETDDSVAGDSGFAARKFPQAKFESRNIRAAGKAFVADGTLTIRGISRPLRFPFDLKITGDMAHMTGSAQTHWAEFGMGKDMGAELPNIGPSVTITVDVTARRNAD